MSDRKWNKWEKRPKSPFSFYGITPFHFMGYLSILGGVNSIIMGGIFLFYPPLSEKHPLAGFIFVLFGVAVLFYTIKFRTDFSDKN